MLVENDLGHVMHLLEAGHIKHLDPIRFYINGVPHETTVGRLVIYELSGLLVTGAITKKSLNDVVIKIKDSFDSEEALRRIHKLGDLGARYATGRLSISMDDSKFEPKINLKERWDSTKNLPTSERIEDIDEAINSVTDDWFATTSPENNYLIMANSGARVSPPQVRSMIVAKGLLINATGKISDIPILENLSQGMTPINWFNTAGPARRSLANNFFIVPATGYLSRQLTNAARDILVVERDCGTIKGIRLPRSLIRGRNVLEHEEDFSIVRSPVTCESSRGGVCQVCCGMDPGSDGMFRIGMSIGAISAQHLGEPGTQLGLRGKHTSGSTTLKEFKSGITSGMGDIIKSFGAVGTQTVSTTLSEMKSIREIFEECDSLESAATVSVLQIRGLYEDSGVEVAPVHFEVIIRGCSDNVIMANGKKGLRSYGEKGEVVMNNVSQAGVNHASWLKSIGHGWIKKRLTTAIQNEEVSYGTSTEIIMYGGNAMEEIINDED